MTSIRGITGGLVVPGMVQMSLADVVRRALTDATAKSVAFAVHVAQALGDARGDLPGDAPGGAPGDALDDLPADAPEAVKITAYRVVQEALSNNLRHHGGA
jgi:hypothetical protein